MKPWLTVVIPSYRGERWVDATFSSLAAEASEGIEFLLIDGSPTTETIEKACSYSDRLSLRVERRIDLTSWQAKTNVAVQLARSEHICWLGIDDLWLPGRARAAASWIRSAPELPLHLAPAAIVDANGRPIGTWRCPLPAERGLSSNTVMQRLLIQNFICAPAPVFRKDAWQACGGLDESLWYTADWDMWLKLIGQGSAIYHDEITVAFRIHKNSLTIDGSRQEKDFTAQMSIVLDRHLGKLKPSSRSVERAALASIAINTRLAAAARGRLGSIVGVLLEMLKLGPITGFRYFRNSRFLERVLPRLRLKLTGGL